MDLGEDPQGESGEHPKLFFFFTLVTGPGRSLRMGDTRVYEP